VKGVYFVSYAVMATIGLIIIGLAQIRNKKNDGSPINFMVLKAVAAIAVVMWIGSAASVAAYQLSNAEETWGGGPGTTNLIFIIASVVGALFVAFFAWQMIKISRELDLNRRELKDLAEHDALTKSWNRRILHDNLKAEVERAEKSGQPLSLLMIDVDNFTKLNKEHGYKVGDGILREIVSRINSSSALSNTIYRYEDDDIAFMMPGANADTAKNEAERLAKVLSGQPYDFGSHGTVSISVSVGVSTLSGSVNSADMMIENTTRAVMDVKINK